MSYSASQELLKIENLGMAYTPDKKALDDINATINQGELITVIGPSGAGKSTFLRCINRLIKPTEGSIMFEGKNILELKQRELRSVRTNIAMIFQGYNLVYRLSTIQNVLHGRLGYKNVIAGALGLYTEEEKERAFEILDSVGLAEFAYRRADQLSGGQKQRVGIARALIQDPKIILCDEPIASLDPKSSRVVMQHLRDIVDEQGITCIVNLHQIDFALEYSDRIIGLRNGKLAFEGRPEEATQDVIRGIYEGTEDVDTMVSSLASRVLTEAEEAMMAGAKQ